MNGIRRDIPKAAGVYVILCKATGKVYVGSTCNLQRRRWEHKKHLVAGSHSSRHLQRAWNKYGASEFEYRVIETCGGHELQAREQHWMDHHKAWEKGKGYNVLAEVWQAPRPFGGPGRPHTKADKDDQAERSRRMWQQPGFREFASDRMKKPHVLSDDGRKRAAEARESQRTPEWGRRISEAQKGRAITPDTRAKISGVRGGPSDDQVRQARALFLAGGKSIAEVAALVGVSTSTAYRIKTGRRYGWIKEK